MRTAALHTLRRPGRPRAGWLFWLLLASWLAAQTLGLMHRELHGLGLGAAVQVAGQVAGQGDAFHSGSNASDCRLYDHAGLADALPCFAMPAPAPLPPAGLAAVLAPWLRPLAAPPFLARGPPALP